MDITEERDKKSVTKNETKSVDPILRAVIDFWSFYFPHLVNTDAKRPSEVFPLLNPPWLRWWL
jgi:hypothetical protein